MCVTVCFSTGVYEVDDFPFPVYFGHLKGVDPAMAEFVSQVKVIWCPYGSELIVDIDLIESDLFVPHVRVRGSDGFNERCDGCGADFCLAGGVGGN